MIGNRSAWLRCFFFMVLHEVFPRILSSLKSLFLPYEARAIV